MQIGHLSRKEILLPADVSIDDVCYATSRACSLDGQIQEAQMKAFGAEQSLAVWLRGRTLRAAQQMRQDLRRWAVFWNNYKVFALGRNRIDSQYSNWQQEYASYFGIRPTGESRSD